MSSVIADSQQPAVSEENANKIILDEEKAVIQCNERYKTENDEKGDEETVSWCRKAAKSGNAEAQYLFGMLVYDGRGVQQDNCVAMLWWMKAAEQNHAKALVMLGNLHRKGQCIAENYPKAIAYWKRAAVQNNVWAYHNLGTAYYDGIGVDKNPHEAVRWWKKAAELGFPESQNNLGCLLYTSQRVRSQYAGTGKRRYASHHGDA